MYGRQYGRGGDMGHFFRRDGAPLTMGIIVANIVTFLISFALIGNPQYAVILHEVLAFTSRTFPMFFWTLVTWPIAPSSGLLGLLFSMLAFFWIGGSLERSWGTRTFAGFMAATSALTALTLYIAGLIFHVPVMVGGLYLASAAPLVAWATINRREVINVYGIFPIPAPILAWVTVAVTWYSFSLGMSNPLFGLFSLSGCAAAYWYASKGGYAYNGFKQYRGDDRPSGFRLSNLFKRENETKRETRIRDEDTAQDGSLNPLRRMKEERERKEREKRLEDMFRRSGYGDDESKER